MTTDVRTLLHGAAEKPERAPDIDRAMRSARDRRRRGRGLSALAAVVVLALIGGALVLGGGGGDDHATVALAPRQGSSAIPEGWQTFDSGTGITIAIPPTWKTESPSPTPNGVPVLNLLDVDPVVADVLAACTRGEEPVAPAGGGSVLTMWEYPADATTVPGTNGETLTVVDRPDTFANALIRGVPTTGAPCPYARYDQVAFRDSGRVFMVRVASAYPTPADMEARLRLATQVLDTLRVTPIDGTTTTSPTTSTAPIPVQAPPVPSTTTLPPFTPVTTDEQQISDLVATWLTDHPDDVTRTIIEDADGILVQIHEGLAQHSPADLALYSGYATGIRMLDADHAEMQYVLLANGQAIFGVRTGVAVRIDGRWMVSRDTECALLSLGGIACPE